MLKYLSLLLIINTGYAFDVYTLGTFGSTFPVVEKSLLKLLQERAQTLDWSMLQKEWVGQVESYAHRPTPIVLSHATKVHRTRFDPSIVLTQNIKDISGHVLFPKGMRVNPFDYLTSYQPYWLFIDADDKKERLYAQKMLLKHPDLKIILVKGNVPWTSDQLKREVYFDQGGALVARLNLLETPAFVYREGRMLTIEYGVGDV